MIVIEQFAPTRGRRVGDLANDVSFRALEVIPAFAVVDKSLYHSSSGSMSDNA